MAELTSLQVPPEAESGQKNRNARKPNVALLQSDTALLLVILLFSYWLAQQARLHFDFFDMSAFLDAGWRVASGQQPYTDFFYLAGPVHLWMHALFFQLFGFGQNAVLAHLLVVNAVAMFLVGRSALRRVRPLAAWLIVILFGFSFYGPIAHPWYDQNAFLWYLVGLAGVNIAAGEDAKRWGTGGLLAGVGAALAFFTKANIGLAALGSFALLLVLARGRRAALLGFVLGILGASGVVLGTLESPMTFFYQTLFAYDARSRLTNFVMLYDIVTQLPFTWIALLGLLVIGLAGRFWWRVHRHKALTFILLNASAIFIAYSGSMQLHAKIMFAGPVLLSFFEIVESFPTGDRISAWRRNIFTALAYVATLFLLAYAAFASIDLLAWQWRPSNLHNTYTLRNAAFRGWRCNPEIGAGVDQVAEYLETQVPRESSVFVFPDATVLYGITGRTSFPRVPFIFHLRQIPPPGRLRDAFVARMRNNPPDVVVIHEQTEVPFFRTDRMLEWLEIDRLLAGGYGEAWKSGAFRVYRRDAFVPPSTIGEDTGP